VTVEFAELKEKILRLLEEDREFRYAVAGLIGLDEILKRLDKHEEQLVKIWERLVKIDEEIARLWSEVVRLREDMMKGFESRDKELAALREEQKKIWGEIAKLREDMIKGFERHDKELEKLWAELNRLREDMTRGFERHDKELAKLREDMIKGFERHDQQFVRVWSEIEKLREDMVKGFERHDQQFARVWSEIAKLREDMIKGFERIDRRITALGARWGIEAEEAFREGLKGILEKELGLKVEKWKVYDEKGVVYGYPCEVEVDVAVVDGKTILVEITSHARASDVYVFKRKAELYKEKTGRVPDRLIIVTPFAEEKAFEAAVKLGVEVYTKI